MQKYKVVYKSDINIYMVLGTFLRQQREKRGGCFIRTKILKDKRKKIFTNRQRKSRGLDG